MKKELSKTPIQVKHDWENNPKVRPNRVEFKGVKAPIKKEAKIINPDVTKGVPKGDGKMVDKISMVRHDLTLGKRPGSPKKMEKYSSNDGSLGSAKEMKPAKTMKEDFSLGFNKLYYTIMQEAADPNAPAPQPPAPPAPQADPAAAGAPPPPAGDPAGAPPPPEGEEGDDLDGGAGMGIVGQLEEAYQALVTAMESVQNEQAKEQFKGVKDNLSAIFEALTGTGFPEDDEGEGGEDAGIPGEVPNMEQTPPDQAGAGGDPNAAPPPPPAPAG